jgi:branched-subunit amino acid transport protein
MDDKRVYISLATMILTVYAIRVLPFIIFRKEIKNKYIRSFLHYVPYVTLAVMTFPSIVDATQIPQAGTAALLIGIALAWFGASLFQVSACCCIVVFAVEFFLA